MAKEPYHGKFGGLQPTVWNSEKKDLRHVALNFKPKIVENAREMDEETSETAPIVQSKAGQFRSNVLDR